MHNHLPFYKIVLINTIKEKLIHSSSMGILSGPPLKLRPGHPCSAKTSQFNNFEIPALLEQQEKPNWAVSRLLVELQSAAIFRMALIRHNNEAPITIGFGEGVTGRRLLHFEVHKDKVILSIQEEAFAHYLRRFPSTLPADNQPIGVFLGEMRVRS